MNAFINIQIRVLAQQAQRQLAAIAADINALSRHFNGATAAAGAFGGALGRLGLASLGSRIQWLGRQLDYNFTLPIGIAAVAASKWALANEAAMARVIKVYGDGARGADFYAKEIEALERSFRALSDAFGVNQAAVIDVAADWAAAGASGLALAKAVKLTLQTMILGEMEAADATQALIAIQAQYGQSSEELARTIQTLNMVENQTGITMQGLVQGFVRAAGTARSAGVDVRHLAAMLAALVPAAGTAAQAGNSLKTIFSRLLSPTQETAEILGEIGINLNDLSWQSASMVDRLQILATKFDGLTDSQQNYVSSVIASRWQVNRFDVLMRELISDHGYYQRALDATSDAQANFNQMQRELNTVLSSNPKKLQIIWTMLQNAAAEIITPMIPLLLYLARTVKEAVTAFSDLNPGLQKLILVGLLLIAAVGPLVRLGGALMVLLFALGTAAQVLLTPLMLLGRGFIWLAVRGIGAALAVASSLARDFVFFVLPGLLRGVAAWGATFFGLIGTVLRLALAFIASFGLSFRGILTGIVVATRVLLGGAIAGISSLFTPLLASIASGWARTLIFMSTTSAAAATRIRTIMIGLYGVLLNGVGALMRVGSAIGSFLIGSIAPLTTMIASGFIAMWSTVTRVFIAGGLALQRIWAATMVALPALLSASWRAILLLSSRAWALLGRLWLANGARLIALTRTIATGVLTAMTGPIGIAVTAAVLLLVVFWKQIRTAMIGTRDAILAGFNKLPQGIQNAMLAVIRTIAAAIRQIRELLSYLNPFARHSPSLVDNVTRGMQVIARQFSLLNNVATIFDRAGRSVQDFSKDMQDVARAVDDIQFNQIRSDLIEFAPSWLGQFDSLYGVLKSLREELNGLEDAFPYEQAQAFADALFNNEQETARLRLQLMDMEDAIGPLDELENRINAINGLMEMTGGEKSALRDAGAGGEILSQYDDQLAALKDQKSVIEQQMAPIQAITDQIEALQRASDRINLEQQLALDPITRQAQDLNQAIQQVTDSLQSMASLAQQAKQAADAAGSGADLASLVGDMPDVGGMAQLGREGGIEDQAALIDQFTADLAKETADLFGAFDLFGPIKNAWNKTWDWLRGNIGPAVSTFWDTLTGSFAGMGNPFSGINMDGFTDTFEDIGSSIKGAWDTVWAVLKPGVDDLVGAFKQFWKDLQDKLVPKFKEFKDLVEPAGKALKNLWEIIKPLVAILAGALLLAFTVIVNVIANVVGPILGWLIDIIGSIVDVVRGVLQILIGIFTGDWALAWQGLVTIVSATWDAIWSTIVNFGKLIWGVISGIVEGIVDFFKGLYDTLVGHSIIPDIVNGIIEWFQKLWDKIKEIWNGIWNTVKEVWESTAVALWKQVEDKFNSIRDTFAGMVDKIKTKWGEFIGAIKNAWSNVKDNLENIKTKFTEAKDKIGTAIEDAKAKIQTFIDKILSIKSSIANAFTGMFDPLAEAFKSVYNRIVGWWNNLSFTIGGGSILGMSIPSVTLSTPNIGFLAQGGLIAKEAMAIVGEGRKGFPEYVIPTDPAYRRNAMWLFRELAQDLGVSEAMNALRDRGRGTSQVPRFATGGILGSRALSSSDSGAKVMFKDESRTTIVNIYGDLEFPNLKSGDDIEEFIKNLEALVDEV